MLFLIWCVDAMKRAKSRKQKRTIQEILDSDDELTTDYIDTSYIPAYQDDTRFEYLELTKKTQNVNENPEAISNSNERIKKGILNGKDIFCFQCIQNIPNDTLSWFFKFLVYKECTSYYKFLTSCLVPKYQLWLYKKY